MTWGFCFVGECFWQECKIELIKLLKQGKTSQREKCYWKMSKLLKFKNWTFGKKVVGGRFTKFSSCSFLYNWHETVWKDITRVTRPPNVELHGWFQIWIIWIIRGNNPLLLAVVFTLGTPVLPTCTFARHKYYPL